MVSICDDKSPFSHMSASLVYLSWCFFLFRNLFPSNLVAAAFRSVSYFFSTHARTFTHARTHALCPEWIFVDHFLHVNSFSISNWESHKMEWPFLSLLNKYLPSSLTTKQPGSYHRKLIPFLGAWQPGSVHRVVPHGQLLNSEGRSWGSVVGVGDNISVPRLEHVHNLTDTNWPGYPVIYLQKNMFFLKARVALERETWSLGANNGMFL